MAATFSVRPVGPADWESVRRVRLAALGDTPDAFGMTAAEEEAKSPEEWRTRLARADIITFHAEVAGARGPEAVGMVVGAPFEGEEGAAGLFGMWVDGAWRGRGIGRALIAAVVGWARARGHRRLLLDVADGNADAIRLYAAAGFEPTGETGTLPPPRTHVTEHRRALRL